MIDEYLKHSVDDDMFPVLMNEAVREVTPHLDSFRPALKTNGLSDSRNGFFLINSRVEFKDFKELVHEVGVGEEEEEDDLDDGDADDEEGGRPLRDDPTVTNNMEVIHHSFMPEEISVFSTSIPVLDILAFTIGLRGKAWLVS